MTSHSSMARLALLVVISLIGPLAARIASAAPAEPSLPREETAVPHDLPGETETDEAVFTPAVVPERALHFQDPSVAALATRIADGSADLRDRREWYAISLLYAPFDALPPSGWRVRALRQGAEISLENRRRQAAQQGFTIRAAGGSRRDAGAGGSSDSPDGSGAVDAATLSASYSWAPLGPTNYMVGASDMAQGRGTALWVHPTNTNFLFAGFADGGVWKTTNGGANWTPLTDFEVTTSVGSLDVLMRADTVNLSDAIIYVGLGEGNTGSNSVDGAGVLKSTNGGATWTLQTLPWANPDAATSARFRHSIRRIVIDTNVANAQSVWVAGDGGVYHTADGGANWSLVTGLPYTGKAGVGGCWPELATDFLVDTTSSPSRLLAAFGARSNASGVAALSCTGVANDTAYRKNNGVYRSSDGGTNWTLITGGSSGFPSAPGNVGRITLLQAPSNKKQIYALVSCVDGATACANGTFTSLGIFSCADSSVASPTWTVGSTGSSSNFCSSQCWFNLAGGVDPTTPSRLIVAGLDAYISTNSGSTVTKRSSWTGTGTSYLHADSHAVAYANATTVFVASDGGIFKGTITAGSPPTISWTNLNGGGLSTLQFYGIGQHPTTASRVHGGLQDNGEAYTASGASWSMTMGGDGGFSATDPSNGEIAYEEYVYGGISRSTSGGAGGWSCIQSFGGCSGCGICVPDGQTSFIAPVVLDANNPAILYSGSKFVYRNSAAPSSAVWSAISPDLVGTSYDNILNIHSAPNNGVAGTIWVTTLNGKVWSTTDNGANWRDWTKPPLPNNPVLPNRAATWIASHPADATKAIVVFSGWNGAGSQPGHVFRTLNGGSTWTDISGALPDEPVFTVAVDPARPNDVYIGTEYGVYVNTSGWTGSTWTKINLGQLPSVHVHQLEFSRANGKLRAATQGRGIWELSVTCPSYAPPTQNAPTVSSCGTQVSWTPSGSSGTTFNVYRGNGACPGTSFAPVASGLSGTSYHDGTVSGGLTYSYKITTAESPGSCESTLSNCQSITIPSGCPCLQPPTFGGAASVAAPFNSTCSLNVSWAAGSSICGGAAPVYNVYRSTTPNFTPTASNRIATCVSGTSFLDQGGLVAGTPYYYIVRAEDGASGGGPCRGGIEEGNQIRKSGSPLGTLTPVTFTDGAEGAPQMTMGAPLWSVSTTRAHSGTHAYFGTGVPTNACAALTTPTLVLGPAGSPSVLSFFSWRDNLENTYDGGIVEISTDGGGSWTKLPISPTYPTGFAGDATACSVTAQPPTGFFSGNDIAWQGVYTASLAAYAGQTSLIRFNLGTDPATTSTGWYIDDIQVTNASTPSTCSTAFASVPEVSSTGSGQPLLLTFKSGAIVLRYEQIAGAGGYNIYEGSLGNWYSHAGSSTNTCGADSAFITGRRQTTITPAAGNRYYLVTAYTSAEGPSGFATAGEIPPAASTCTP